jgi:hypothetical protein
MKKPAKPNHCVLLLRLCWPAAGFQTWRSKLGLFLLTANVPIGILGAALFAALYARYDKPVFIALALLVYAFSWLMLLAGLWLCGKTALTNIKHKRKVKYRAWKYLRHKRSSDTSDSSDSTDTSDSTDSSDSTDTSDSTDSSDSTDTSDSSDSSDSSDTSDSSDSTDSSDSSDN